MCKYMSIILGIIGKKKNSESIIGRFWSIIDSSLGRATFLGVAMAMIIITQADCLFAW